MASLSVNASCPCGSGSKYKRCCRPLHEGAAAPTPEALMRSRYCAYALGLIEYIISTTHPEGPQWEADRVAWAADIARFCRATRFEQLRVRSSASEGDRGEVTFFAKLLREGEDVSFAERSSFVREGGRWLYWGGVPA